MTVVPMTRSITAPGRCFVVCVDIMASSFPFSAGRPLARPVRDAGSIRACAYDVGMKSPLAK
jgi:hypothetical protein